jgi:hypothetical protein
MLFWIFIALMILTTIVDGVSQHYMLYTNGGKGQEANTEIYGKLPTYWDYSKVNLPILAFYVFLESMMYFHYHVSYHWIVGLMIIGWHIYGTTLNAKYINF